MMQPEIIHTENGEKVLSMTKIAKGKTYYGIKMLDFLKKSASPEINNDDNAYSSSQHVCTTAVLESLKVGLGPKCFGEITKTVLERSKSSHSLAVVELARAIINKAAAETQPHYKVDADSTQANTTKKTDTPSSDNDKSPPSSYKVDEDSTQANTTKKTDTPSSDKDKSPPSSYKVDADSTQTNTTKKTDTPSSDNNKSPPSSYKVDEDSTQANTTKKTDTPSSDKDKSPLSSYRADEDSTQTNTTEKTDTPSSDNDESPSSPGLR